ncbi:MAG: aminopeptidase P family protein [Chitinophagia bacterium]|nr:aminopeptidase P family protein [Chitinophagia bacterium]
MIIMKNTFNRRNFLGSTALLTGGIALPSFQVDDELPPSIHDLKPMIEDVVPITVDERKQRIAKAQELMAKEKLDAIFMEGTTTCFYFTGMRWGQSERTFGVVIPAKGEIVYVCPKFEDDRAKELINTAFGSELRCWEEHESPYQVILNIVKDRGVKYRRIGMEERVRFFIADGVRKIASGFEVVDATPVTAGCRMYKTKAEIALMQKANDVTIEAYKAAFATIVPGMSQSTLSVNIASAFRKLGYSGGASVQVGKYSALPHGSITPQTIREGDVVMVDGGTSCEGYASDITRTIVVGKPTQRQTDVWNLEKKAQDAAFAAMKIGAPCEVVDAAARKVIEDAGFGKNYGLPGLPHRTGHGIGLEGHEWTNFVKGNTTKIAPGMCFSDEPTISIPGEFGIRLEDCVYISEDGPHFFTKQSISIEQPFG